LDITKPIENRNSTDTPIQQLLNLGVVHLASSPKPGEIGNSYIIGRARPETKLQGSYQYGGIFKNLKEAKNGGLFHIYDENGKKLTFKIFENIVINDTDVSTAFKTFGKRKIVTLQTNEYTSEPSSFKKRLVRGELTTN
jgi:sortase (surface protein transpeptidase)